VWPRARARAAATMVVSSLPAMPATFHFFVVSSFLQQLLLLLPTEAMPQEDIIGIVPLPASSSHHGGSSSSSNNSTTSEMVALSTAFTIVTAGDDVDTTASTILARAFARCEGQIFAHGGRPGNSKNTTMMAVLPQLTVNVHAGFGDVVPQLHNDESYSLVVTVSGATAAAVLSAPTLQGALHGLETFSQLCRYDFDSDRAVIVGAPWHIQDTPRFTHRELMLDTARHFYPPRAILQLLDAMSAVKLNVFHWHIADSTSFPLVVPGTNLSKGAYSANERYSRADVEAVVQAAQDRAIRVVPEWDLPAHTGPAWCIGEPTICTQARTAVDPSAPRLFEVIDALVKYASEIFPDKFIHMGGDEVTLAEWTHDTDVAAYLKRQHPGMSLTRAAETEAYGVFMTKLQAISEKYNKTVVHWEDAFDWAGPNPACGGITPTLSNTTVVQVFRGGFGQGPKPCKDQTFGGCVCGSNGAATTKAVVEAGYRAIWGPPSSWYLSCYANKCGAVGSGAGFESWEHVYAQEPFLCQSASAQGCGTHGPDVSITDPDQQRRVLGGAVTVWSERLDPAIMLATAFPRAAAAAERMWSPRAKDIVAETRAARPRMERLRCLLLDRGLAVSILDGGNEASNYSLPSRPSGPASNC
jgi:hexosaminidase